jgi:hypothetical protein
VSLPIVLADEQDPLGNEDFVIRHLDAWTRTRPAIAIVGMGTLAGDHHWAREVAARREGSDAEQRLNPVIADLERVVEVCERVSGETAQRYVPVAEICNNLFFVDPPPGLEGQLKRLRVSDLRDWISRINRRLITFKMDRLNDIAQVMLIAGGVAKACGIYWLLGTKELRVRMLCTNRQTAELLLEWAKSAR